jgi:hypothetical protein
MTDALAKEAKERGVVLRRVWSNIGHASDETIGHCGQMNGNHRDVALIPGRGENSRTRDSYLASKRP